MSSTRWRTYENGALLMLGICFALVFLDRLGLMFLMPFVAKDLSLSNTQVGMLGAGLALAWAVSGMVFGAISDRSGRRKALLIAMVVGFSLCTGLSGLATGFLSLLAVRVVMGLFEGPVLPLAQTLMNQASSAQRRGFNMAVLQNGFSSILGLMLGPPLLVGLAGIIGWRHSLLISAVPGLLMAAVLWRWLRETDGANPDRQADAQSGNWRELLAHRNVIVGMVVGTCLVASVMLLMTFTSLYLVRQRGFAPDDMGMVMAMFGLGTCVWSVAGARWADKWGRKPVLMALAAASILTPLSIAGGGTSPAVLALLVLLTMTGGGCVVLVMAVIPAESVGPRQVATAMGLIMGTSEVLGGVVMPVVAGAAADAWGPAMPFVIAAACALAAVVSSCWIVETRPRPKHLAEAAQAPGGAR